jgi:poly-gamma-glutamate capsule biosynthesis protein CapA/YwtB (metallophosphatase superfamily)
MRVDSRDVTLAAVGDINLGDGVRAVMRRLGLGYPWTAVGPLLRAADIAFGNLECAVSTRGHAVFHMFNFRGSPDALRVAHRMAGLDVVNLANNHTADYGTKALLDTISYVRAFGMLPVGAGRNAQDASRPRVIRRLGLRVAFVGFSDIPPFSFGAGRDSPGTQLASESAVRRGVRAARRQGDVVVATFHWGIEGQSAPNRRQLRLAHTALDAGADVVIGGHPHMLQPILRAGRRLVAYSLGNFVFPPGVGHFVSRIDPGETARTGILELSLGASGVRDARFVPAVIQNMMPRPLPPAPGTPRPPGG